MTTPTYDPRDYTGEFTLDEFAAINDDALTHGKINSEGLRRVLVYLHGSLVAAGAELDRDAERDDDDVIVAGPDPGQETSGNGLSEPQSAERAPAGTSGTPTSTRKGGK
jgi:hypothetical protein